ncbi:hypothetical protein CEXT_409501 [Caerostris extrusa]|uniref:Uncharacterized protein n=1 Tax=Caerostris extrusa TaxID=172846 RepID=A0AAV4S6Z1_CAEEX|nr:hypothetical protein CEXT_409501 [Caerostris extrusa]
MIPPPPTSLHPSFKSSSKKSLHFSSHTLSRIRNKQANNDSSSFPSRSIACDRTWERKSLLTVQKIKLKQDIQTFELWIKGSFRSVKLLFEEQVFLDL